MAKKELLFLFLFLIKKMALFNYTNSSLEIQKQRWERTFFFSLGKIDKLQKKVRIKILKNKINGKMIIKINAINFKDEIRKK